MKLHSAILLFCLVAAGSAAVLAGSHGSMSTVKVTQTVQPQATAIPNHVRSRFSTK